MRVEMLRRFLELRLIVYAAINIADRGLVERIVKLYVQETLVLGLNPNTDSN